MDKMEPTERKEQLRKKFEDFLKPAPAQFHSLHRSDVFDFFYSEIESRDRLLEASEEVIKIWFEHSQQNYRYTEDRVNRLEKALEKYNSIKQQSKT